MRLSIVGLCSLVALLACAGDKDGAGDEGGGSSGGSSGGSGGSGGGEVEAVCPAATVGGEATHGDANNDGLIDISDSVMTFRYLVAGGAAPYCADAMDFIHDDLLDLSDATSLLYVLFGADGELPSYNLDCDSPTAVADAECGVFDLSLDVSNAQRARRSGAERDRGRAAARAGPGGTGLEPGRVGQRVQPDRHLRGWHGHRRQAPGRRGASRHGLVARRRRGRRRGAQRIGVMGWHRGPGGARGGPGGWST